MICERCGEKCVGHSMSWFTLEEVCLKCKKEEELCPNYKACREAEESQCRAGNFNYVHGLSPEDSETLRRARAARKP
jgi:hypothetical protein